MAEARGQPLPPLPSELGVPKNTMPLQFLWSPCGKGCAVLLLLPHLPPAPWSLGSCDPSAGRWSPGPT